MITLILGGGLGNQMFEYALYRKLESDGYDTSIDDCGLRKYGNQHNGLELERVFGLKYRRVGSARHAWNWAFMKGDAVLNRMHIYSDRIRLFERKEQIPYEAICSRKNRILFGCWQSEDYFSDIADTIRKDFTFQGISEQNYSLAEKLQKENSVSVHIRRGDYLLPENQKLFGGICTLEYYQEAISLICNRVPSCRFYIFTNDPGWVKENFSFLDYQLVDWNTGADSYQDMYLMSQCRHHIIANSSFSWWGAWLGNAPGKIVVAPKKWLADRDWNRVVPEGWEKI